MKEVSRIKDTYTVLKITIIGRNYSYERMAGNLCVNEKGKVMGHLSELGSLCGLTILKAKNNLLKNGYLIFKNK